MYPKVRMRQIQKQDRRMNPITSPQIQQKMKQVQSSKKIQSLPLRA